MESNMVETRGLKKYYRLGDNVVKALDGVDFTVREQEFVAIIGRSGSGKSTLLHMVGYAYGRGGHGSGKKPVRHDEGGACGVQEEEGGIHIPEL